MSFATVARMFRWDGAPWSSGTTRAQAIARAVGKRSAVLDGEIVMLARDGRSQFRPLLARRGVARFCAFDLLWLEGRDLRRVLPLLERKVLLRQLVPASAARLLYVEHVGGDGAALLRAASGPDLEGVVGKYAHGIYQCGGASTSWVKVKNPDYSQVVGRRELFDARRGTGTRAVPVRPRLVLV
jgi:bifunctional non-homologous end joining protein LigD